MPDRRTCEKTFSALGSSGIVTEWKDQLVPRLPGALPLQRVEEAPPKQFWKLSAVPTSSWMAKSTWIYKQMDPEDRNTEMKPQVCKSKRLLQSLVILEKKKINIKMPGYVQNGISPAHLASWIHDRDTFHLSRDLIVQRKETGSFKFCFLKFECIHVPLNLTVKCWKALASIWRNMKPFFNPWWKESFNLQTSGCI